LILSSEQLSVILQTSRKARGLTQADVAGRLGVSQNRFSEIERNVSTLTVDRLLALARELGLEILVKKREPTHVEGGSEW
ncbi:MAG: hypothetical protein RLZZ618_163, partial [Pseudomonadota bacterium]